MIVQRNIRCQGKCDSPHQPQIESYSSMNSSWKNILAEYWQLKLVTCDSLHSFFPRQLLASVILTKMLSILNHCNKKNCHDITFTFVRSFFTVSVISSSLTPSASSCEFWLETPLATNNVDITVPDMSPSLSFWVVTHTLNSSTRTRKRWRRAFQNSCSCTSLLRSPTNLYVCSKKGQVMIEDLLHKSCHSFQA